MNVQEEVKLMNEVEVWQYLQGQLQKLVSLEVGFQIDVKKIKKLKEALWWKRLPSLEAASKWIKKQGIKYVGEGPGGLHNDDLAAYLYFLEREGALLGKDYMIFDEEDAAHVGIFYDQTSPKVDRAIKNVDIYGEAESIANRTYFNLRYGVSSKNAYTINDVQHAIEKAVLERKEMGEKSLKGLRAELQKPEIRSFLKEHYVEASKYEMEIARLLDRRKWLEKKKLQGG